MNPEYVNIGLPEDKVIEECAELIQAILKAKRFGYNKLIPDTLKTNKDRIFEELSDVEFALEKFKDWMDECL